MIMKLGFWDNSEVAAPAPVVQTWDTWDGANDGPITNIGVSGSFYFKAGVDLVDTDKVVIGSLSVPNANLSLVEINNKIPSLMYTNTINPDSSTVVYVKTMTPGMPGKVVMGRIASSGLQRRRLNYIEVTSVSASSLGEATPQAQNDTALNRDWGVTAVNDEWVVDGIRESRVYRIRFDSDGSVLTNTQSGIASVTSDFQGAVNPNQISSNTYNVVISTRSGGSGSSGPRFSIFNINVSTGTVSNGQQIAYSSDGRVASSTKPRFLSNQNLGYFTVAGDIDHTSARPSIAVIRRTDTSNNLAKSNILILDTVDRSGVTHVPVSDNYIFVAWSSSSNDVLKACIVEYNYSTHTLSVASSVVTLQSSNTSTLDCIKLNDNQVYLAIRQTSGDIQGKVISII